MNATTGFDLDPGIAALTTGVAALRLCDLLLMNDARFAWLLLVPRRAGVTEIVDLDRADRALLLDEIVDASMALKTVNGCDKLNVAAIGNVVSQLHVHVVARFRNDPAWPKPVWGFGEAVAYQVAARDNLVRRLRAALPA